MALFKKDSEEKKPARNAAPNVAGGENVKKDDVAKAANVKDEKKGEVKDESNPVTSEQAEANGVLVEPWITEKTHELMSENKYVFRVTKDSTKKQVKKAIENLYSVEVINVNIVNIHPKKRRFGTKIGKKAGFKKAIATLKDGDKIKMYE